MLRVSTALGAGFSALLSLLTLNYAGPMAIGVSKAETAADTFTLYGTMDSAATDATNAQSLGQFTGVSANPLPQGFSDQVRTWPYVFVNRTGGSTAGTLYVTGNSATNPAVISTAAPSGVLYSAVLTLTACSSLGVRIGGSAAMTASDVFDVFLAQDSTVTSSVGCYYAGRITGGGGLGNISVLTKGWPYAIVQRVSGATAGNILAAGVGEIGGSNPTFATIHVTGVSTLDGEIDGADGIVVSGGALNLASDSASGAFVTGGSVGLTLATTGNGPISVGNGIGTGGITIGGGGISSKAITIGDTTGASPGVWNAGTGGIALNATGAGGITLTPGITGAVDLPPRNVGSGQTTLLRFFELAANGSNWVGFKAADAIAANISWTLPNADATISGQVLSSDAAGTLSWGSGIALGGTGPLTLTSGSSGTTTLDSGTTGNVDVATGASVKTTRVGSITGASVTSLRAGSGALNLIRNGITWGWPSADGVAGAVGGGSLLKSDGAGALGFTQFQSGTATLTSGTVTIAANITANSRITFSLKGSPAALTTQIVAPTRNIGAPGSFVINGLVAALTTNGADNTTTIDWFVIG